MSSAFWASTQCVMCHSHFPDNLGSIATLAGKVHSNGLREHTCTYNIAHPVNRVIRSEDGL